MIDPSLLLAALQKPERAVLIFLLASLFRAGVSHQPLGLGRAPGLLLANTKKIIMQFCSCQIEQHTYPQTRPQPIKRETEGENKQKA